MFRQVTLVALPAVAALLALGTSAQPRPPMHPAGPPKLTEEVKIAEIGEEAPPFALKDQHGKTHTLAKYKGKIVVLEWFNETCPYCKGVWESGLVPKLIDDLRNMKTEVVYLAVNSSANRTKEKVLEGGVAFLEELEIDIPMLMDYDGKVGHAFGARTTPHMFVIDAEGVLVYSGALSNDRRLKKGADAETHVARVIEQLNNEEEVSPEYVQPWGCSVKYARGDKKGRRPQRPRDPR